MSASGGSVARADGGRPPRAISMRSTSLPSVLARTPLLPVQGVSAQPLAFPIPHAVKRFAATGAAIARGSVNRRDWVFMAARPLAKGPKKNPLLRDHGQVDGVGRRAVERRFWRACGVPVPHRHAGAALLAAAGAWLDVGMLATDEPASGTRSLGNTAGSSSAVDSCDHTPCANKSAPRGDAPWRDDAALD
jgi:hypothetical protein